MARKNTGLLGKLRSKRNLEGSWKVIKQNGRFSNSREVRAEVERFDQDASKNIERLYRDLFNGSFQFLPARGVPISKGNRDRKSQDIRPIVLANIRSRIVQRATLNVLMSLPGIDRFLTNPYSFGGVPKRDGQLAAVPAAIDAVLRAIGTGANYVMYADIESFFSKVPKSEVTRIVAQSTLDPAFDLFFEQAIKVELANMDQLRGHLDKFPIEDIGVAQGNSLSPLLGNILLHDFDRQMNEGDCRCIRYIDDFIILAPTAKAAGARLRLATKLLGQFAMTISPQKSSSDPVRVDQKIQFLGVELANGFVRPSRKAQNKLVQRVSEEFQASSSAFASAQTISKKLGLVATLKRVDGIVEGWGKHYRFCNDKQLFKNLDIKIDGLIRDYLGTYSGTRKRTPRNGHRALLGIEELSALELRSLRWPAQQHSGDE